MAFDKNALWVVTVYYNPCGYKSRRNVYEIFREGMRAAGINLLTVECAFGSDPYQLPRSMDVVRMHSNTLLWQKERLLNIGASYLPESCRFVAWVDCDVIFANPDWIREACSLLSNGCTIVQPWQYCSRLGKGNVVPENPDKVPSFASIISRDISTLNSGRYDNHGHTGYAWAIRREILDRVGLYEYAITGSADHFMAHAIFNDYGLCIINAIKRDVQQTNHLKNWGKSFYPQVQGKIGFVTGEIQHLWHGDLGRRGYFFRTWKTTEYGYNPYTDLIARPGRPFEWKPKTLKENPELVAYFEKYFQDRQEDTSENDESESNNTGGFHERKFACAG